jgi:hypothetical protein
MERVKSISSPPVKNLEDSFNYAKKLYDTFTHSKFVKSEIASVLNFTASSGGFALVLNALRNFDFIELDQNGYLLTENFKNLNFAQKGSNDFKKFSNQSIINIPLYVELLGAYQHKLPPQHIIAQRLELNKKMSPNWAKNVARAFEESLKYAGFLDNNNNILPFKEELTPETKNTNNNEILEDTTNQIEVSKNILILGIPLKDNRVVKIYYPNDMTMDEAKKIANILNALTSE